MPTLILSPRFSEDSQALWRAAGKLGWKVERLTNWHVPESIANTADPVFYLEGLFASTIAEQFGRILPLPPANWLPSLPAEFRKRNIELLPALAARQINHAAFFKPPNDKSFPAGIYQSGAALPTDIGENESILVAEIVSWEKEFRCFLLNREPQALSVYLRDGQSQKDQEYSAADVEIAEAEAFIQSICADTRIELPPAIVLDVGVIAERGWAVVELNAAWGSGIYGCDPVAVLHVLEQASRPVEKP
ncbi:MAG: ATP-grasp domain-containing protein [Zavarzinella sp.]